MAFQHPQQRRARTAAHQQHEEHQEESTATELSTSVDSEVLLFGGDHRRAGQQQQPSTSNSLQLIDGPVVDHSTWSLVPPQASLHQRTHSPASTYRSSASSATSSLASPATGLAHSLFPSHDGGGVFVQGAESLVASDTGVGGAYSSSLDDSSIPSGASALSDDSSLSGRPARRRDRSSAHHTTLGNSVGGSWALTEEALSTVPHATPLGGVKGHAALSQGSAEFTSDSSEDESVEGALGVVIGSRKRTPVRRRGAQQDTADAEGEDDDGLSTTPHAISAGLESFIRAKGGRNAYPSPPPEDSSRLQTARNKRRHRHSGRNTGSQKRSSTSGSVAGSEVLAPPLPSSAYRRRSPAPKGVDSKSSQDQVFLGPLVSRLLAVESSTLDLLASSSSHAETTKAPLATPEATPTPSRAASPTRLLTTPRLHSLNRGGKLFGLAALGQHARDELGDERMFYLSEEFEEEEEDGDATETEMDHHSTSQWVTSTSPPTFAPRSSSSIAPARSLSASSLPMYLPPTSHDLSSSHPSTQPPPLMRRGSSFSASSPPGAGSPHHEQQETAWGGEFEGFEAAMSYWRRLLRVMRGGFGGGTEI